MDTRIATKMSSPAALQKKLAQSVEGEVRFDRGTLAIYSTDSSNYRRVPIGVVIPRHEGDVAMTLAIARANAIPILARGGGTSLAGQTCNTALVLDFSKYMNRILAIDVAGKVATVEPGVVQNDLNRALAPSGLFFAPDPSTKDRCTLGGMIGNNSCGAHSAAYGKTVDNVEALEAILYDGARLTLNGSRHDEAARDGRIGELIRSLASLRDRCAESVRANFPRLPRRVSGYNLDELLPENNFNIARALVGSEGTLAVTLKATVKLVPRPRSLAMAVLGFDDVYRAADQTPWILEHRPEAVEGFDHHLPEFARLKRMAGVRYLPDGRAFLLIELGGENTDTARGRAERLLSQALRTGACTGSALICDPREQMLVWKIRESGLGSGAYIPGRPRTWPGAEDAAVPPARLGKFLRRFNEILSRRDLAAATYYGHFGEGCVHSRINFDLASASGVAAFRATIVEIAELVTGLGGSLSGEHGDGRARSELLPMMFPPDLIEAFRNFKRAFDPDGRMNPGVIADPEPLDSHLKLGPNYHPRTVDTYFDFSSEDGLAGAALKCVGIGKCRKTDAGAMCPSYMATREERHCTRGRARLLFEALAGDTLEGFADPELKEALDLCLSCKACKSECPAGIDMAAYRAEFFANYHRHTRRSLAGEFFGRMHEVARAASFAPRFANAVARTPIVGSIGRRMLGIHPSRELPRFAPQSFRSWFERRPKSAGPKRAGPGREVVLFPDTFTNFLEPRAAIAAAEVLERAGFRVTIPPRDLCCGRPLYDQGMLERAKWRLQDAMAALRPFLARGTRIVGLEPSCILTFRDELPAMFPRDETARALASNSMLLDEFLAAEAPGFVAPRRSASVLVHGHCHQKAISDFDCEIGLLSRVEGLKLQVLDAGCCGMAGAFGYDRGRFELSRAIGERVLFRSIRESSTETIVIADGFSCRTQIRQFCPDHRVMHLAELLNDSRIS